MLQGKDKHETASLQPKNADVASNHNPLPVSLPANQAANHLYVPITQFVTEQTDIGALIRTHFGGDEARDKKECQQNDVNMLQRKVSRCENSNKTSTDIDSCDQLSNISKTQNKSGFTSDSQIPESAESNQNGLNCDSCLKTSPIAGDEHSQDIINAPSDQEPNDELETSK